MKKPVKKKRTGWHPVSEIPKKKGCWYIVCDNRIGWISRGYYSRGKWRFNLYDAMNITHWHNYPKLPKDEG